MVDIRDRSHSDSSSVPPAAGAGTDPGLDDGRPHGHDHFVQFYEDEDGLGRVVAAFLGDGVRAGDALAVIATASHCQTVQRCLESAGVDVARLLETGQLRLLDVHETLSRFMRSGEPDPRLFHAEIGGLFHRMAASDEPVRLRAYGEMVDVLWTAGQRSAALRLEELWNDLQDRYPFRLLCAYSIDSFYKEPAAVHQVCSTHEGMVGGDRAGARVAIEASQHAQQLAREIAHRGEVERALRESLRELRHKEEQLRQDITARMRAEQALRAREAQLQTIIDALPVLVGYVGVDGRYELVSAGYERWFARQAAEIRGKHIAEVIGPTAYEVVRPHLERAFAGQQVTYEVEMPYASGTRFVQATLVPQRDATGQVSGVVTLVDDITERRSFETYRAAAAQHAQRLLTITSALADAVTTDEVFEAVVDRVAAALGASSAALWLVDDDGGTVRLARTVGYSGVPAKAFDYPDLAAVASIGRSGQVSCLPLSSNGHTLGVLGVMLDEAREPTEDERNFLQLVARYAGQAIERLRLHHGNVEARLRAEQLYRFAYAAASADKLEDVFEAALDAIERALGAERAALLLFDDDGVMRFRAWRNLSEDYRRAVEGHSPWPRDATAPQPVLVPDVEADPSLADYLPVFRSERIGSLAFIPLVTRGRLLGKFMVYYGERHHYSTTELELATAISNHLASVTARFAALAELERTVHYSELFAGVLAHDLRNPLGAIVTAAQLVLMRQEGEGDRNAKPVSRIVASGQRMARMIDQLLDFTRARVGGGIEIQTRDTNLADLCSQAISELELVYSDRKIACSVVGDQGGTWDPDRLLQIISNLVANASQHGVPDSAVTVRLDGRQADEVVLEVHNRGTISPALLPTLFDPFRRTRHRREHARGLGLGLFIVKQLVRAHGGTVDVTSSDADGTTFRIRLPRRAAR